MERYRHFKGRLYQVLMLATKEDTEETLVIYQALYGSYGIFARELSNFLSPVDKVKYPNATQEYRFEKVTDEEAPEEETPAPEKLEAVPEPPEAPPEEEEEPSPVQETDEDGLPPALSAILDAREIGEKIALLQEMHGSITSDEIDIIAVSIGVEIEEGDLEERYQELLDCMRTIQRYEIGRDRLKSE